MQWTCTKCGKTLDEKEQCNCTQYKIFAIKQKILTEDSDDSPMVFFGFKGERDVDFLDYNFRVGDEIVVRKK